MDSELDETGQVWEDGFDSGYKQGHEDARQETLDDMISGMKLQTRKDLHSLLTDLLSKQVKA